MDRIDFTVAADHDVGICHRFWTVANWNRPFRLLDAKVMAELPRRAPFISELNCVYLLGGRTREHNCWYQGLAPDGAVRADFSGMIDQLRGAVDRGYTPWIVLDNVPYDMSGPPTEHFYGNTAPPADERIWHQYVRMAVEAMVEAFGRPTVGRWWFRVGTEPDLLPGHWCGTKEQYFAHYDYTVDAVLGVLPEAMIGPGNILNPVEGEYGIIVDDQWGLEIIDHAARGRNACTGGVGATMRWFSCSWYGRVGVPLSMFDTAMRMIRDRLRPYPHLADLPVCVGEFAVLHDEQGRRLYDGDSTEWAASFYAGIADRAYSYGVQRVYEWAQTVDGVLHPRAQVIEMLSRMADGHRLAVDPPQRADADCGLIACRKEHDLFLLAYNHATDREAKLPRCLSIAVAGAGLAAGATLRRTEWSIDEQHGVWARALEADCRAEGIEPLPEAGRYESQPRLLYGEPGEAIFARNRDRYAAMAVLPVTRDDTLAATPDGAVALDLDMPGHSVRLVRLSPTP
jgi:xylan 1,4-beta-xylosidase